MKLKVWCFENFNNLNKFSLYCVYKIKYFLVMFNE